MNEFLRISSIVGLALAAMTAQASERTSLDIIQLKPAPTAPFKAHLGWRCTSLLREDYSLHRGPGCQNQDRTARPDKASKRELQVMAGH